MKLYKRFAAVLLAGIMALALSPPAAVPLPRTLRSSKRQTLPAISGRIRCAER